MSGTYLHDKRPRARKQHRCWLCGESIEPGEVYVLRSGIGDDGPQRMKMHVECEAATKDFQDWEWEETYEGEMPRGGKEVAE